MLKKTFHIIFFFLVFCSVWRWIIVCALNSIVFIILSSICWQLINNKLYAIHSTYLSAHSINIDVYHDLNYHLNIYYFFNFISKTLYFFLASQLIYFKIAQIGNHTSMKLNPNIHYYLQTTIQIKNGGSFVLKSFNFIEAISWSKAHVRCWAITKRCRFWFLMYV